ncbi:MAG: tetratricopeptide repeat protein [Phycisphaerae bacterium]
MDSFRKEALCGVLAAAMGLAMFASGCTEPIDDQRKIAKDYFDRSFFDKAEQGFRQIVNQQPDALSYYYLGRIYHAEARFAEAIQNYNLAISLDPGDERTRAWRKRAIEDWPPGAALVPEHEREPAK